MSGNTENQAVGAGREGEGAGVFVCEKCGGGFLNHLTGRCGRCEFPVEGRGYCHVCRKYLNAQVGGRCPTHETRLIHYRAAMTLRRFGNACVDLACLHIAAFGAGTCLSWLGVLRSKEWDAVSPIIRYAYWSFLVVAYYMVFEGIWQRTPGKMITGTKVITACGDRPDFYSVALRSLVRVIPFEGLTFLGEYVRGWHDRWSETYVVRCRFPETAGQKIGIVALYVLAVVVAMCVIVLSSIFSGR